MLSIVGLPLPYVRKFPIYKISNNFNIQRRRYARFLSALLVGLVLFSDCAYASTKKAPAKGNTSIARPGSRNHPPSISPIGAKSVAENSALSFTIVATDSDRDPLTYSASNLPSGAAFNTSSHVFSWTPSYSQAGSYSPKFSVSDGKSTTSITVAVTVTNVNRAPNINPIPAQSVNTGTLLSFTVSAADPDNDTLSYSLSSPPSGASIDATSGLFQWTPATNQAGVYSVTVNVSDGKISVSAVASISVAAVVTSSTEFGVHVSSGRRSDGATYALDLGSKWVRITVPIDNSVPDLSSYLTSGLNVVLTTFYRSKTNSNTQFGLLSDSQWAVAGFPFVDRATYIQDVKNLIQKSVIPYLSPGQSVIIQVENEVGDASVSSSKYWAGTTDQYMAQLNAFAEAVHSLGFEVMLSSVTSQTLDALRDPLNPKHDYQLGRVTTLLSAINDYDAVDLHYYGCASDIGAKTKVFTDMMPAADKLVASTENAGPNPDCKAEYVDWHTDLNGFEIAESNQVNLRLKACADNQIKICLWFSEFDVANEVDSFNHLGLLTQETVPREKAAYGTFKAYKK